MGIDPITLAIGSTVAGTAVNILSAQQQGRYQAALARRNQQIENQNAKIQREQSLIDAFELGDQARDARGSLRAAQGASGFDISSTSSSGARQRQDALFKRQHKRVLAGGAHAARAHRIAGVNYRLRGQQARRKANYDSLGYAFSGGASAFQLATTTRG